MQCEALIADPIAGNEIDGTIIVLRASISLNNFIFAEIASEQHDIVVSWDLGIDRYFESSSSNFETKLLFPNQLESKTFSN